MKYQKVQNCFDPRHWKWINGKKYCVNPNGDIFGEWESSGGVAGSAMGSSSSNFQNNDGTLTVISPKGKLNTPQHNFLNFEGGNFLSAAGDGGEYFNITTDEFNNMSTFQKLAWTASHPLSTPQGSQRRDEKKDAKAAAKIASYSAPPSTIKNSGETASKEMENNTAPTGGSPSGGGSNALMYIGLGLGVLVVGGVIFYVVKSRAAK